MEKQWGQGLILERKTTMNKTSWPLHEVWSSCAHKLLCVSDIPKPTQIVAGAQSDSPMPWQCGREHTSAQAPAGWGWRCWTFLSIPHRELGAKPLPASGTLSSHCSDILHYYMNCSVINRSAGQVLSTPGNSHVICWVFWLKCWMLRHRFPCH